MVLVLIIYVDFKGSSLCVHGKGEEKRAKRTLGPGLGSLRIQSFAQKMARAERNRGMQADKDELSQPKSGDK